jgi:large subunit ribosomal protein L31
MGSHAASIADLEAVYRRDLSRFVRAATAIVGDESTAADAVQEAFASAVRSRRSYRGEVPLEGWIWRIVVNAALQLRRAPTEDPGRNSHSARLVYLCSQGDIGGPEMQKTLHPHVHATTVVCASCGTTFELRSTAGDLTVDVCARCHPAYTGVEWAAAFGSRVERFERRRALAA